MWSPSHNTAPTFLVHPLTESRLMVTQPMMPAVRQIISPAPGVTPSLVRLLPKEEIIAEVCKKKFPRTAFHDYSENGEEALFFMRPSFALNSGEALTERVIRFDEEGADELHYLYDTNDISKMFINFNHTGSVKNVALPESLSREAYAVLLSYSLLGRHMRKVLKREDVYGEKMMSRTFPREYVSNRAGLNDFNERLRELFNRNMNTQEAEVAKRHVPTSFTCRSPGQVMYLVALLHRLRTKKSKNTKLFIFALCAIIYGPETYTIIHFSNLLSWFTRDTCDSCFEKGLFQDIDITYQYSTINFEYSEREVSLVEDANLNYRILEHGDRNVEYYPSTMFVHEHSFVTMRSKSSTLKFLVGSGESRVVVATNVHRGMAIIMAIDGVVRVARARLHGEEFHLFNSWVVKHKLHLEGFTKLRSLIVDIVMCGVYHPPLLPLSKMLCFCVMFGVVPDGIISEYKKGDDLYSLVLSKLSRGRSPFVDLMIGPCFSRGADVDGLIAVLNSVDFSAYYCIA